MRRETRIDPAGFDKIARSDFGQRNAVELARSEAEGAIHGWTAHILVGVTLPRPRVRHFRQDSRK